MAHWTLTLNDTKDLVAMQGMIEDSMRYYEDQIRESLNLMRNPVYRAESWDRAKSWGRYRSQARRLVKITASDSELVAHHWDGPRNG